MGSIKVYGTPIAQGSMECLGPRGKDGRHLVVDSKRKELDPWRDKVTAAATALRNKIGPLAGAVSVSVTITVARPPSVPLAKRAWPIVLPAGDLDKHQRSIGDALTESGLINDDSQICHWEAWQAYPDTPGCPDRLDRPGALIRIEPM